MYYWNVEYHPLKWKWKVHIYKDDDDDDYNTKDDDGGESGGDTDDDDDNNENNGKWISSLMNKYEWMGNNGWSRWKHAWKYTFIKEYNCI